MTSLFAKIISPFLADISKISDSEFTHCVELARCHGLEMLLYSRLKTHYAGILDIIDKYLKLNGDMYLKNAARSLWQESLEKEIISVFTERNIRVCLIKGNDIARSLYGDPNCRHSSDIDLLIRDEDLVAANEILLDNDYFRQDSLPLRFWKGRLHHAIYQSKINNSLLELHWDFGIPGFFNLTSNEIWNAVTRRKSGDYSLTPEMVLIQLFIHHFRHAFREVKILVDILWGFYRYERIVNWSNLAGRIKKIGLVKTTTIIIGQLEYLWSLSHKPLQTFVKLQRELAGISPHTPHFLLSYFRMDLEKEYEPDNITDKMIARLSLDDVLRIILSFVKILLPRPQDIAAFYPETSKWMLPVNYLRFILWRLTKLNIFAK